jgi:3-deoxy-manno-octulosonate cytidylyltransferase (CMP-KDO synthetase)
MLRHVWEKCAEVANPREILVATDDDRILEHCNENGMQVEMTSSNCLTGTDRLYEVSQKIKSEIYINVQGDEPLISPKDIKAVIVAAQKEPEITFNAMCKINKEADFWNANVPKVVTQKNGFLLYISRSPIPTNKQYGYNMGMKQVCIYAYPYEVLKHFGSLKEKTPLESIEDIEILRLLELGYKVKMIEVSSSSIAVDTPGDLEKVRLIHFD